MLTMSIAVEVEDCQEIFREDSDVRKPDQVSALAVECLQKLIETNDFKAASNAVDTISTGDISDGIAATRKASEVVQTKYDTLFDVINEQKNVPVKVSPPFTWYQDLYRIYIEVKHANRFDVAGCGTLFNETIKMTDTKFHSSASCAEAQETKILYELKFSFWGAVKEDYKFQKKPVGKFLFTFDKAEAPGRWR